jgi:uncharacterized membrane protein YbaN (DUF454 family)
MATGRQAGKAFSMRRTFWTGLGLVALALGGIGILLPLLPTTPFVLLAAFAFGRGSPRLRHWLETHPRFGPPIRAWEDHGAIAPRHKRGACVAMAATLGISTLAGLAPFVLAVQALCLGGAAAFILTRPDGPPNA